MVGMSWAEKKSESVLTSCVVVRDSQVETDMMCVISQDLTGPNPMLITKNNCRV